MERRGSAHSSCSRCSPKSSKNCPRLTAFRSYTSKVSSATLSSSSWSGLTTSIQPGESCFVSRRRKKDYSKSSGTLEATLSVPLGDASCYCRDTARTNCRNSTANPSRPCNFCCRCWRQCQCLEPRVLRCKSHQWPILQTCLHSLLYSLITAGGTLQRWCLTCRRRQSRAGASCLLIDPYSRLRQPVGHFGCPPERR